MFKFFSFSPSPISAAVSQELGSIENLDASSLTLSSVEIAQLCEKRHDHVLRDIDKMILSSPDLGNLYKLSTYKDGNGISRRCFECTKRGSLLLVTGYSITHRLRLIDRWIELETAAQSSIPAPTLSQAIKLLANQAVVHEEAISELKGQQQTHAAQHDAVFNTVRELLSKQAELDAKQAEWDARLAKAEESFTTQKVASSAEYLSPTKLAEYFQQSSNQQMNKLLETTGLQVRSTYETFTKIRSIWVPTELGMPHCMRPYGLGGSILWDLSFLKSHLAQEASLH